MMEEERLAVITYRLENARQTLTDIQTLIENQLWNFAINRMYYACYYAVTALLIKEGITAQTHAGVRQMLGLHFIKTGKLSVRLSNLYSNLFDKRQNSDYEDFTYFDRDTVEELYPQVVEFIDTIEKQI